MGGRAGPWGPEAEAAVRVRAGTLHMQERTLNCSSRFIFQTSLLLFCTCCSFLLKLLLVTVIWQRLASNTSYDKNWLGPSAPKTDRFSVAVLLQGHAQAPSSFLFTTYLLVTLVYDKHTQET